MYFHIIQFVLFLMLCLSFLIKEEGVRETIREMVFTSIIVISFWILISPVSR